MKRWTVVRRVARARQAGPSTDWSAILCAHGKSRMLESLDRTLFAWLNRGAANPVLDWVMPRITSLHHRRLFLLVVGLACVALLFRGSRWTRAWVLCAIAAVALSDIAAFRVIKAVVPRQRPCYAAAAGVPYAVPDVRLVPGEHCPGSPAFPSNHAANMMAVGAVGWWFTRRRTRWLWMLLPLVIGYSRIYLGYHYPSDVLGGWVLGALIAAGCIAVARRLGRFEAPAGQVSPADASAPTRPPA